MTNNQFATALKSSAPPPDPPKPISAPAAPKVKRKHIGGYFDPEVSRRLRMLASEEETTVQQLLTEALTLLFSKRGMTLP